MAELREYPTREQLIDAVGLAIEIVRDGQIVERKDEFAKALWNVQGSLQYTVFGQGAAAAALPRMDELKSALTGVLENGDVRGVGVDWAMIIKIIKLILELLNLL